ncbi:unnamed protein product, partial [Symbiodinium sp. CCMP2456]
GNWSAGRAHSALCIAGRAAKQVKEASKLQQFANSVEQDVCRITFSLLAHGKNSAAQNYSHFQTADGDIAGYQGYQRVDSNLQRMKELGVVSHFVAQRDKLVSWLAGAGAGQGLRHAVVVRVFDDTNVWVAPSHRALPNVQAEAEAAGEHPAEEALPENRGKKTAGKQGKRKVSPLLGIIQKIFVRGDALARAWATIPLKVLVSCSLVGLVRMAHVSQSTLFRQRLHAGIKLLVQQAERHEVASLPDTIVAGINDNRKKLSICASDLTEKQQDLVLCMLNHRWSEPLVDGKLQHWCAPGCCASVPEMRARLEEALMASLGNGFEVPLLYRWKHFEPAVDYALRNTAMHGLLAHIWPQCMNSKQDDVLLEQVLDDDAPDLDPSVRQQVRLSRVYRLLCQPDTLSKLAQCVLLTRPLSAFMDRASLVDTVRHRFYLRVRGLNPPSKCPYGEDDLRSMNLGLLSGERGLEVVQQYYHLLLSEPESADWFPEFDLPYTRCILLIFTTMCDSWRRLVLPYQSITSACLRIASMSTQEGLEFLWREQQKLGACTLCKDQHFAQVLMKEVFAPGLTTDDREARYASVQSMIRDLLLHVPASSVEVEKQHAGVQIESDTRRAGAKRPTNLQRDSYILSTMQDHAATLQAVEAESFGAGKRKVNLLLRHARLLDTTAPAAGRFDVDKFSKDRPRHGRAEYRSHRIGKDGANSIHKEIAKRWRELSPRGKARFKVRAEEMQAQREQLMKEPLSRKKPDSLELTQAQVQRLGNQRLDTTLQQVSDHEVWSKGLGLWDHVSALRKEHVLPLADDATARFQGMFSYDGIVTPNAAIPSYEHPCVCSGGGVCRRHDLYEHVASLISQFDSTLVQHKLAVSEPLLLCIAPEAASSDIEVNIYASRQLTFGHEGGNFLVHLPRDVSYRAAIGRERRVRRQAPAERRRKGRLPFGLDAMVAEMHPPAVRATPAAARPLSESCMLPCKQQMCEQATFLYPRVWGLHMEAPSVQRAGSTQMQEKSARMLWTFSSQLQGFLSCATLHWTSSCVGGFPQLMVEVLPSCDFGVPQLRTRLYILMLRTTGDASDDISGDDHAGALIDLFAQSVRGSEATWEPGCSGFTVWDAMAYVDSSHHDWGTDDEQAG